MKEKKNQITGFRMHNELLVTVAYNIILFNCMDFHILPNNELDSVILHSTLYISNPIHSYNNKFPIKMNWA